MQPLGMAWASHSGVAGLHERVLVVSMPSRGRLA